MVRDFIWGCKANKTHVKVKWGFFALVNINGGFENY
jgi:hypothetical protein